MHTRKPLLAGVLAGLLAASLLTADTAGAAPPRPADRLDLGGAAAQNPPYTVTLLTGDQVVVSGDGQVAVRRGDDRDHITFLTYRADQHQYVIPSDALPLVTGGRLDRRLFDVTLLREHGYHDVRDDLPLIVAQDPGVTAFAAPAGVEVVRELPAVDGAAVRIDKAAATDFWRDLTGVPQPGLMAAGVTTVWLDGVRQPLLDQSVPQIGAPAAYDLGLDGTGVKVAVIDTGIDADHPDLADRIVAQANFTEGEEDDRDLVGHGTHVAGIVAGSGAASGGQLHGVAPGAELLDAKVCAVFGCLDSWIIGGMQWAAEQGAAVANISLGGTPFPDDPVEAAVDRLTDEFGVLFAISAGNAGPADATMSSPATADAALAVGAVERDDEIAFFSSRGPRPDGALKPDLTAPGVGIVSANSKDGFLGEPGEPYTALSGTSMSAPHAAGAAAILSQQHPEWTPERLKAALMGAAAPHPELRAGDQGAGRLDVARAVTQAVTTSPASVSYARQEFPHDDDEPEARTITYRNDGDTDVTLALAVTATGPDGGPVPAGMFTLSPASVTVPAGGTAPVSLTSDTSVPEQDGFYGGRVVATGGDMVVQTPFGVDREVETYDVTFRHLDRDGAPTSEYFTFLARHGEPQFVDVFGEPEVTVRVPAGDYLLGSFVDTEVDEEVFDITVLSQLRLEVAGEMVVTVDARAGEPVSLAVPDRSAEPVVTIVSTDVESAFFLFGALASPGRLFTAQLAPEQRLAGVTTTVSGDFAVPARDGSIAASRTAYHLAYFVDERFITGFERAAQRRELARVRADHAAQVTGSEAVRGLLPSRPEVFVGGIAVLLPLDLPLVRTDVVNTDGGVLWEGIFFEDLVTEESFEEVIALFGEPTAYRAGRLHREDWNYAVFGPRPEGVFRSGDELVVAPTLYADRAGHPGFAFADGTITVFRDGEQIAHSDELFAVVEVPPEEAAYRVEVEAARVGPAPLSAQTSLAWEVRSGHVDEEEFQVLPTAVVRFRPPLAPDNTAPAGQLFLVPVSVDTPADAGAGRRASLRVQVSYDDGATWRAAPVLFNRLVLLHHPRQDGFVSLRATATDTAGNTVEQTIIRAYEIAG